MAEGDDAFHHKIWVRCYGFPILAWIQSKKCSYKLKLRISPPQPMAVGKDISQLLLFCLNKCCLIKCDQLSNNSIVFLITLPNLQLKSHIKATCLKEFTKALKLQLLSPVFTSPNNSISQKNYSIFLNAVHILKKKLKLTPGLPPAVLHRYRTLF